MPHAAAWRCTGGAADADAGQGRAAGAQPTPAGGKRHSGRSRHVPASQGRRASAAPRGAAAAGLRLLELARAPPRPAPRRSAPPAVPAAEPSPRPRCGKLPAPLLQRAAGSRAPSEQSPAPHSGRWGVRPRPSPRAPDTPTSAEPPGRARAPQAPGRQRVGETAALQGGREGTEARRSGRGFWTPHLRVPLCSAVSCRAAGRHASRGAATAAAKAPAGRRGWNAGLAELCLRLRARRCDVCWRQSGCTLTGLPSGRSERMFSTSDGAPRAGVKQPRPPDRGVGHLEGNLFSVSL